MSLTKKIAEESMVTRKMREKLQKKIDKLQVKVTPAALKKKVIEMHKWIAKHAGQRTVLRSKSISLFDENQHAAQMSRKVVFLAQQIQAVAKEDHNLSHAQDLLKRMTSLQSKSPLK